MNQTLFGEFRGGSEVPISLGEHVIRLAPMPSCCATCAPHPADLETAGAFHQRHRAYVNPHLHCCTLASPRPHIYAPGITTSNDPIYHSRIYSPAQSASIVATLQLSITITNLTHCCHASCIHRTKLGRLLQLKH